MAAADWENPDRHRTEIISRSEREIHLLRSLDDDRYFVATEFADPVTVTRQGQHRLVCRVSGEDEKIDFVTCFSPSLIRQKSPDFIAVKIIRYEGLSPLP
jgi:hypothetical protein